MSQGLHDYVLQVSCHGIGIGIGIAWLMGAY
jgi:hypothetical protein